MNKQVEEEAPESIRIEPEPEATYEYRFLKLTNGDDILCQVPVIQVMQEMLLVRYPLKVSTMFDPSSEEAIYLFTPWVPFTSQELITINKLTIVTYTTVRDMVKNIYEQKIESMKKQSLQAVSLPNHPSSDVDPVIDPDVDEDAVPGPVKKPWLN
jgi:hypothetical protein